MINFLQALKSFLDKLGLRREADTVALIGSEVGPECG